MDQFGYRSHYKCIHSRFPRAFDFNLVLPPLYIMHRFTGVLILPFPKNYSLTCGFLIQKDTNHSFSAESRSNENPAIVRAAEGKTVARFRNRRDIQKLRNDAVKLFLSGKPYRRVAMT